MNHKLLCCCLVLAMVCAVFPATNGNCAEPAEAAIEAALAKPAGLDFDEVPLWDVIETLKAKHQIEIQIDRKALAEADMSPDVPVTRHVKGVTLQSALNLMLGELDLVWIIDNEVLLVTTREIEGAKLNTRVYDVADLVACRDGEGNRCDDYQSLTNGIECTIAPTTWDTVGGPAHISGASLGTARVLIILQTDRVHRQIATLLADIRAVAAKKSGGGELPRLDRSPPKPVGGFSADQAAIAPAEMAKTALLELIEAKQSSLKADFPQKDMDTFRKAPLEKDGSKNSSIYRWGPFGIDVKKRTYNASVGNMMAMRLYSGKFSVDRNGRWTAEKPSVSFLDTLRGVK